MKQTTTHLLALLVSLSHAIGVRSDVFIVAPNNLASAEGNTASGYPFFIQDSLISSMRYQQVYAASQFSAIGPAGGFVTRLFFRAEGNTVGATETITNIQFNLSTTPKSPDNLSPVFSENVGVNDTIVKGQGPLRFDAGGGSVPAPWDAEVVLTTPFYYNPVQGNLLLDIRNYIPGMRFLFSFPSNDAENTFGDSVSSAYAPSVNSNSATVLGTFGLVTRFEFTPIPEPSVLALLLFSLPTIFFAAWRHTTNNKKKKGVQAVR